MRNFKSLVLISLLAIGCSHKNYFILNYKKEFNQKDFEMMVKIIVDTILTEKSFVNRDSLGGIKIETDTLIINPDVHWTKFYLYGNEISDEEISFYPTLDLKLENMNLDLRRNRPVVFLRTIDNQLWDPRKLLCSFYQPVILEGNSVIIMIKRWYMGSMGDYIYEFQKKSKVWHLKRKYKTLTHYGYIKQPMDSMPDLTEDRMYELREKLRRLPTKKIPDKRQK